MADLTVGPIQYRGLSGVSALDRFLLRIEAQEDGCWLWTGGRNSHGYGHMQVNGRDVGAHRFSYEHFVGSVPDGLHLDHLCRVRHCVNPDHLEPVTCRTNILRGVSIQSLNAKKTHCHKGHLFDAANTIVRADGRACRACQLASKARYRSRTGK